MPSPEPLDTPADARSLERWSIAGLVLVGALVVAFPFYRAGEPSRRAVAMEEVRIENVRLGEEAYALHCAACHGEGARGGAGMPTLAAREFLEKVNDTQLRWLIAGGVPGTQMPAYHLDFGGPFTAQEIDRVVAWLRSLEESAPSVPGWASGAPAPPPRRDPESPTVDEDITPRTDPQVVGADTTPVSDPQVEEDSTTATDSNLEGTDSTTGRELARPARFGEPLSPAEIRRAAELYGRQCAACHGAAGEGTAIAGPVRPPVPPLDTLPEALVEAIAVGRPGTTMMGYSTEAGGSIEPRDVELIARWLAAARDSTPTEDRSDR